MLAIRERPGYLGPVPTVGISPYLVVTGTTELYFWYTMIPFVLAVKTKYPIHTFHGEYSKCCKSESLKW